MSRTHPESILPTIATASGGTPSGGVSVAALNPTTTPPRWVESIAQNLVTSLFQPMSEGHLRILCPDGSTREFGTPGQTPSAEIHLRRWRFFTRCAIGGDMGFGESYQDGDWETPDLAAVIAWFCANVEQAPSMSGSAQKRLRFTLLNNDSVSTLFSISYKKI